LTHGTAVNLFDDLIASDVVRHCEATPGASRTARSTKDTITQSVAMHHVPEVDGAVVVADHPTLVSLLLRTDNPHGAGVTSP